MFGGTETKKETTFEDKNDLEHNNFEYETGVCHGINHGASHSVDHGISVPDNFGAPPEYFWT